MGRSTNAPQTATGIAAFNPSLCHVDAISADQAAASLATASTRYTQFQNNSPVRVPDIGSKRCLPRQMIGSGVEQATAALNLDLGVELGLLARTSLALSDLVAG